jgi:hypothetical protein
LTFSTSSSLQSTHYLVKEEDTAGQSRTSSARGWRSAGKQLEILLTPPAR